MLIFEKFTNYNEHDPTISQNTEIDSLISSDFNLVFIVTFGHRLNVLCDENIMIQYSISYLHYSDNTISYTKATVGCNIMTQPRGLRGSLKHAIIVRQHKKTHIPHLHTVRSRG